MPDERLSVCVIFNPAAGKRRARLRLDVLRKRWQARTTFWATEKPQHAVELARRAADDGFAVVAAAGGDGTVHEVANGLLQAGRPDVGFAVIPLGSANDYAFSLQRERIVSPRKVDVGIVRTNLGAERFFVGCLGIGFSGCVTAEAQQIAWLQGKWLYGLATLRALWRHWKYLELSLSLDDQPAVSEEALMLSLMVGHREGGFLMAPNAHIDDGWLDFVRAGHLSRWEILALLVRLATRGLPSNHPKLQIGRCRTMTVTSRRPFAIHTDGELFSQPADGVFCIEIKLFAAGLQVQLGLE